MNKLYSINPANNEIIGDVEKSSQDEVIKKVKDGNLAKNYWKNIGLSERIKLLRKVKDKIFEKRDELALLVTKEIGMPISLSKADADGAIEYFSWYLDNAPKYLSPEITYSENKMVNTVYYEPVGLAVVIMSWNFPLSNFIWGTIQNLICGNTVIYKGSKECPLLGKALENILNDSGFPKGVFGEVYGGGKLGDFLIKQDINLVCFTGSTKVGKKIYKTTGDKFIKAVCELGGSAPGIIFEDADLDLIIETVYANRFSNCGQVCDGLKRLIVHKSIFDETVDRLKKLLENKKTGNPQDESIDMGPLVSEEQLKLLEDQVNDAVKKGAKVVIGGKRIKNLKGAFYEPTILTNLNKNLKVWQEEVFGPVLPIVDFETNDQAVRMANDTKYGLGSYIYTKDAKKALETAAQIETGMVSINNASYIHPASPFGGIKDSGIGREHGKFGFYELTQTKVVAA